MDLPEPPSGSAIIRSVGETEARLQWKISRLRADRLHLLVAAALLGASVLVVWLSGVLELSLVVVLPSAYAAVVGSRMLRPALREGVALRDDSLTVLRTPNRLFRGHGFTWESVYPKHSLGQLGHLEEARDKMCEEDLEEPEPRVGRPCPRRRSRASQPPEGLGAVASSSPQGRAQQSLERACKAWTSIGFSMCSEDGPRGRAQSRRRTLLGHRRGRVQWMRTCDVVVVGAGPAGSTAATAAQARRYRASGSTSGIWPRRE